MAPQPNINIFVYYNREVRRNESIIYFESQHIKGFKVSVANIFSHLKKRIAEKLNIRENMVVSEIICWNSRFVTANTEVCS